jgi:DNA-binding transcriptional ArsR family regulator
MDQSMDAQVMSQAESQAALCSVFANPKRVLILWTLAEQEKAVTAIANSIHASLQNTSQHLNVMKAAGILQARRDGQTIYYRIADNVQTENCRLLLEARKSRSKHPAR